ncbi:acetate--CoA ligase family protein [bacterium]|nr:acetate--CoA ligase family protein [bacterium]
MNENILNPKSIAIVGASTNPKKISTIILQNLIGGGYNGKVYPVNPKYEEVLGRKSYSNILAIKEDLDQVCIAIPAHLVEEVIDQCIEKKVQSVIIISAGFKETGEEGILLEQRIATKLKDAKIRLIGPNSLGYINNNENINLSFARKNTGKGNIAFISQSGAFCTAILDMAYEDNFGFSNIISIGNKADIFENELIEMFQNDSNTTAIALYIEEFSDGKEFVKLAQQSKKPIIVIAPGSSEKAKEAISSHTGSLASSYETTSTAISKGNTILAENSVQLYNLMKLISYKKIPKGKKIAVVSNAGGPGIIATDNIEKYGLTLSELGEKTTKKLLNALPSASSMRNPVDILGDALSDRYEQAISVCENDKEVDCILVILTPQLITDIIGTAEKIVKIQNKTSKPIFACFLGKHDIKSGVNLLNEYNIYSSSNIEATIRIISKLVKYNSDSVNKDIVEVKDIKTSSKYITDIKDSLSSETIILPDDITENILKEHNIAIPEQIITPHIENAIEFAVNRFPVVIKATSKDLAHKTDVKAVYVDIRTISEFESKFYELREVISKVTGTTSPEILVQEMVESNSEIFIGANREGDSRIYEDDGKGFGHLLAIGQGGIYTEVYKDIEHVLLPTSREDILEAVNRTRLSKIIDGYRGRPLLAKEKLLDMMESIQRLLISYPQIISMDINPVMLTEEKVVAVDTKIYIKD